MGKKVSQTSVKISKKEKKEFNSLIRLLRPKVYITDCSSFKTLVQDLTGNGSSNISIATSSSHAQQQHRVPVVDVEEYQVEPERSTSVSSVDVSTEASIYSCELWNQEMFMNDRELNQLCYQMYSDDTTTTTVLPGAAIATSSSYPQQQHRVPFVDVEAYQVEPERSTSVDVSTDASFDSSELLNQEMFMNDQELNQLCYQMYSDDTTTTNILEGSSPSTADQMVDVLPFQDLESRRLGTEPFDPFNINAYGQIDQEVSIFDYELSGLL